MPRDKKIIHRATSDVEDEDVSDEEENGNQQPLNEKEVEQNNIEEERKKYLKDIILRRTLTLKKQREREHKQVVSSTKQTNNN